MQPAVVRAAADTLRPTGVSHRDPGADHTRVADERFSRTRGSHASWTQVGGAAPGGRARFPDRVACRRHGAAVLDTRGGRRRGGGDRDRGGARVVAVRQVDVLRGRPRGRMGGGRPRPGRARRPRRRPRRRLLRGARAGRPLARRGLRAPRRARARDRPADRHRARGGRDQARRAQGPERRAGGRRRRARAARVARLRGRAHLSRDAHRARRATAGARVAGRAARRRLRPGA